ncbi:MAG: DJ-1/PfpI/YhbO family deglycase/protease [Alphaproteobacteria bacterium]
MTNIQEARILIMATDGFEQSELIVPRDELRRAGATVEVATPDGKSIRAWAKTDWGETVRADRRIADVEPDGYDALVLPGGQINPDKLRMNAKAMSVVRGFLDRGKTVAAICHAPWLLVEADAVHGRQVTSYPSIRTDIENAGGQWVDRAVVCDRGVVTSRAPDDLPAFIDMIVAEVEAWDEGRSRPTVSGGYDRIVEDGRRP